MGIAKSRGPMIASAGYDQIFWLIRYASQGRVAKKAMMTVVEICRTWDLFKIGYKMRVRKTATGIVNFRCLD